MRLFDENGYIPRKVFQRLENDVDGNLSAIAECIRYNTLLSVGRAGTGHLGASLSMVELLADIYFRSFPMTLQQSGSDRNIFILSKGHGAPSLYATLAARGFFPTKTLERLRRVDGLPGHCDIAVPGIEANTGSLAMGLSKAVGHAITKKRFSYGGCVVVIVGDGELQEGQCWEALMSASSYKLDNLYVIIDDNTVQTDQYTKNIVGYGDLSTAIAAIGFHGIENKGKTVSQVHLALSKLKKQKGKPKLFWCSTMKGQGVSFMEHTAVLKKDSDRFLWHNKAPNVQQLEIALSEVLRRCKKTLQEAGFETAPTALLGIPRKPMAKNIEGETILPSFAQGLLAMQKKEKNVVVLDGDLEEDCGFIPFHKTYPRHFFEMGIMEQHMVGTAAALSRSGFIPVIGTYAAFLTSRANEQLYNLASEDARAIIAGVMAGVIPATPGKSHQAFRDIACIKNIPGISLYQPVNGDDVIGVLNRYIRGDFGRLLYLRLSMAASAVKLPPVPVLLPQGVPQIVSRGKDCLVMGIGPVVLGECMAAADLLSKKGISCEVWNHPWITSFDVAFFRSQAKRGLPVFIVEDHSRKGGFGESFLAFCQMNGITWKSIRHIALDTFPVTGFREEALESMGLDRNTIVSEIMKIV